MFTSRAPFSYSHLACHSLQHVGRLHGMPIGPSIIRRGLTGSSSTGCVCCYFVGRCNPIIQVPMISYLQPFGRFVIFHLASPLPPPPPDDLSIARDLPSDLQSRQAGMWGGQLSYDEIQVNPTSVSCSNWCWGQGALHVGWVCEVLPARRCGC